MKFSEAFYILMTQRGGHINDPRDPGGATKYGKSRRSYPELDIINLTVAKARDIYRRDYWNASKCDEFPMRARFLVFDCAVNQGVNTAIKLYQLALEIKDEGIIIPITIEDSYRKNTEEIYARFMSLRAMRYNANPNFDRYGKGWTWRLFGVMQRSIHV